MRAGVLLLAGVWLLGCGGTRAPVMRTDAGPALSRGALTRAVDAAQAVVVSALCDPDAGARLRATRLIAELADPALDRELPARLADEDARVRAVAAAALAPQSEVARNALVSLLAGPDARARALALDGVGALDGAAEVLARLAHDPDAGVRARVAQALARPPRELSADALLVGLAGDDDAGVRAAAIRSLGDRGGSGALELAGRALADGALAVRLAALDAIARLDPSPRRLAEIAARTGAASLDKFVALRAAVKLAKLGARATALATVREAATDPHAAVRVAAMNAAGELGDAGAPLAGAALADRDLEVRLAAASALAALGHPDQARPTLAALSTETPPAQAPRLRLDAADELARLGDARGVAFLSAAVRAPDPHTRQAALARFGLYPAGAGALVSALADPQLSVRLTAAEILLLRRR
jgi:HEAT repeat protein